MLLFALPVLAMAQWSSDPAHPLGISNQGVFSLAEPVASRANNGDIYVSYINPETMDYSYVVYLQRLNAAGEPQWQQGGIVVDNHLTMTYTGTYDILATADGGCVVAWGDCRHDPTRQNVFPYVYKVDADGDPVWGINGVEIPCEIGGMTYSVCEVSDGVIFGFHNFVGENGLEYRLVKITNDGVLAWDEPLDFEGTYGQFTNTSDGFILTLMLGGTLKAMRYDKDAHPLWDEWTTIENRPIAEHTMPVVKPDGADGIVVAYRRLLNLTGVACIQHVDCDGAKTMGLRAIDLYDENIGNHDATIALGVNPSTQEVVALWNFNYEGYKLQINKVNFDGDFLWEDTDELGYTIGNRNKPNWNYATGDVICLEDGWLLVYGDVLAWLTSDVMLTKIDNEGQVMWSKTMLSGAHVSNPTFLHDEKQGYMIWKNDDFDKPADGYGLVAQNFTFEGEYGPAAIEHIEADKKEQTPAYYNLQGLRVAKPQPGQLLIKR